MSAGLEWFEAYAEHPVSDVNTILFLEQDMAAYAARKPLAARPDTVGSYSTGGDEHRLPDHPSRVGSDADFTTPVATRHTNARHALVAWAKETG